MQSNNRLGKGKEVQVLPSSNFAEDEWGYAAGTKELFSREGRELRSSCPPQDGQTLHATGRLW